MKALAALALMSLNLHGYHPMDEAPRFLEKRGGQPKLASSDIYFFTPEEYLRGNTRRIDALAADISGLKPDVVFLQEVGAGAPSSAKDCDTFLGNSSNTAMRLSGALSARGQRYKIGLACRGNTGWVTSSETFRNQRVLRQKAGGGYEVVFDYGANPYPKGILVEGTAILVKAPWKFVDHQIWRLKMNYKGDEVFVQAAILGNDTNGSWVAVANLHGGHKVPHFEQSLAIRSELARYADAWGRKLRRASYAGSVVAGDFNAELFRPAARDPEQRGEVSTAPWEIFVPGQFDLRRASSGTWRVPLDSALHALNDSKSYKPFATIQDPAEASRRISDAVDTLAGFPDLRPMREVLDEARVQGHCKPAPAAPGACSFKDRIDLIYAEPALRARNAWVLYPRNDWERTDSVSDHPGVMADFY